MVVKKRRKSRDRSREDQKRYMRHRTSITVKDSTAQKIRVLATRCRLPIGGFLDKLFEDVDVTHLEEES
jgi:hypothetical protein